MENKHMTGLQRGLDSQIKKNKKIGGPSEALKRFKTRPKGKDYNVPIVVHFHKWEIEFSKDLKEDERYLELDKRLEETKEKILEMEKAKNYQAVGILMTERGTKVGELNKRYDELKKKYL